MKNFGFDGYDNVIYIGTNGKMSEVSAAMGLTGLESLHEFTTANYRNYKEYKRQLDGIPGIRDRSATTKQRNVTTSTLSWKLTIILLASAVISWFRFYMPKTY